MAARHQFGGVYWTFQPGPNEQKLVQLDADQATMDLWEFEEPLVRMLRSLQDQKDREESGVNLGAKASPEAGQSMKRPRQKPKVDAPTFYTSRSALRARSRRDNVGE